MSMKKAVYPSHVRGPDSKAIKKITEKDEEERKKRFARNLAVKIIRR